MDSANSTYYTISAVFVGAMVVFGLGILFVRAARMERNILVGSLTLLTTLIAGFVLKSYSASSSQFTASQMISMMMLCLVGFGVGWLFDRIAGPKTLASSDEREATLGSELAD